MNRIDIHGARGVSRIAAGAVPPAKADAARPIDGAVPKPLESSPAIITSAGSEPPVDHDRVSEIRHAIEHGRYPVIPARIADAMIAAGYLLRSE